MVRFSFAYRKTNQTDADAIKWTNRAEQEANWYMIGFGFTSD